MTGMRELRVSQASLRAEEAFELKCLEQPHLRWENASGIFGVDRGSPGAPPALGGDDCELHLQHWTACRYGCPGISVPVSSPSLLPPKTWKLL